ncbi:class E sortase [Streptomyces sp. NBC_01353]|uniref:class E sortase n=1 Tax=Streptomyces sp. NBC_01353 TaxID=2903835 RepID=UPI002E33CDFC|nr:class E sortase [Streptomyces sp. NBC_01353]
MDRARSTRRAIAATVVAVLAALVGCSAAGGGGDATSTSVTSGPAPGTTPVVSVPTSPTVTVTPSSQAPEPDPSKRSQNAEMAIPSIGVHDLTVVPYEGTTDDPAGTRIQDRGVAASPYGKRGGVGPGEIGNYLVTAHRLSAGGPMHDLPAVDVGDKVLVTFGDTVYEYTITETRTTSFRSAASLAEQRAAVPGEPGEKPTRAMITLSTCATPEDNAAGNFWRDAQGNPEHRIDKIGVLSATRPA